MKKSLITIVVSMLLLFSACSSAGGFGDVVEDGKIQREEDQSKSVEERQLETLNQLVQDGAYIEDVTYITPGGEEELEILFQIADDVIEKIEFSLSESANPISIKKAEDSQKALKELLIGKNINEVEIPSSIAGSSLTTTAFKKHVTDLTVRY
jgi:major membrane immunogen (membrane-anchored lipoprotein)